MSKKLAYLDLMIFAAGYIFLVTIIVTSSSANIAADAVDYYAILQRLTPAEEKPIVPNLHFAEQRSPGYSLTALVPYGLFSLIVEPFVTTEQVVDVMPAPMPPTRSDFSDNRDNRMRPPSPPSGPGGSEFRMIPPRPLLLKDVAFKDFYVPMLDTWFQWKLFFSLAFTSYAFLFLGMAANAWMLRQRFPAFPCYSLVTLAVFSSVIFMQNIIQRPLYTTLTAYGVSSLFLLFFLNAFERRKKGDMLIAGGFLGLLVLTRLETSVIAAALGICLLAGREWRMVSWLVLGASWALIVWALYNFAQFGTPLYLGILKGDINHLVLRIDYIIDSLVHPSSGVVFWTPLLAPGFVGLLLSRKMPLRFLAIASLAMISVCLLRVPIMYEQMGGGLINIGGIPITPPRTPAAMRELVHEDNNRYLVVLAPFLVLGLREGISIARKWWVSKSTQAILPINIKKI